MRTTKKITETKKGLVYEARFSCGREPIGYDAEDYDMFDAQYNSENLFSNDEYSPENFVGQLVMVIVFTDIVSGNQHIRISPDNGIGWAGNSYPTTYRYHGWRGTSNDISADAMGLRRILSYAVTGNRSKKARVVFGHDVSNV